MSKCGSHTDDLLCVGGTFLQTVNTRYPSMVLAGTSAVCCCSSDCFDFTAFVDLSLGNVTLHLLSPPSNALHFGAAVAQESALASNITLTGFAGYVDC